MPTIPLPAVDAYSDITNEETAQALSTGMFGDDPALKMVVQDAITAENFENQKRWVLAWDQASTLYQSPYTPRYWEGTQVERASIPFFTVATAVNSLVPQVVNGLFYENPPFLVQARPGTRSRTASAVGALLAFQLEDIGYREELRLGIANAVLYGSGIWKYGWETYKKKRIVYIRKDRVTSVDSPMAAAGAPPIEIYPEEEEVEAEEREEYVDRPVFESIVNLRHVLVDPGLNRPGIQEAKYVIHRMYVTFEDLERLRDREGFNIPPKEEMIKWFETPIEEADTSSSEMSINNPMFDARATPRYDSTTIDPRKQPLELLERWDNDTVIMVLQKKVVICNTENPYGKIPFLSLNWWDVAEAFWGMGLAKTIGAEQRIQQGITNTWMDNAALNLNGVYVRVRGKNVPTQSIRISPGKIVDVDDKDGFKPIQRFDPVPEAGTHIQMSQDRVEKISAANEPSTQGIAGSSGHSNLARSAAGANILASGAGSRLADFVDKMADKVVIPSLHAILELDKEMLPLSTMRTILGDELQHEFMNPETDKEGNAVGPRGDLLDILNSRVRFSISAGAKMMARQKMATALPVIVQYLMSPELTEQLSIQGKKVNVEEILHMFYAVSEWKNEQDVIVPMTKEDKERQKQLQMMQQQSKSQQQNAMEDKKFENKRRLNEEKDIALAGRDVLKNAMERQTEMAGAEFLGGAQ